MDSIKRAAKVMRKALLKLDFGLQDKFCDAEELKHLWFTTRMSDELISFFSVQGRRERGGGGRGGSARPPPTPTISSSEIFFPRKNGNDKVFTGEEYMRLEFIY